MVRKRRNGYWKTHADADLQQLLLDLDAQKWRIVDPPTYYTVFCPCSMKHKTWIHLTPSNRRYSREKRTYLQSHTCFKPVKEGKR